MPLKRASAKDLRQSKKKQLKNFAVKEKIKDAIKKLKKTIESKDSNSLKEALTQVYQILDKAASKKIIHRNKAARKKSRLAKLIQKLSAKKD